MGNQPDWYLRLLDEEAQLLAKMAKLEAWLVSQDKGEFPLMELQLINMRAYALILSMRIEEFNNE